MQWQRWFVFKQATVNKNQVPAKALWVQCIWASILVSGKFGFINLCYICLIAVLHIDNYWCFILRKKPIQNVLIKLLVIHLFASDLHSGHRSNLYYFIGL
jgi:hypothetical protein